MRSFLKRMVMTDSLLSSVEEALHAYAQGQMVIVVDDEDRENEGDLVLAADFVTPQAINFMVTHARGLVCLAMRGALLDRLQIPMMVPQAQNRSGFGTGFTLSVEAMQGVSTGISAEDRAVTIKTLIDPNTTPADIAMPGHIFPLRARDGGVLERRGQTEASVDISALAGLTPAGVICEVMHEDGTMMRLDDLATFAAEHKLHIISVEQLVQFRLASGQGNMATAISDIGCEALCNAIIASDRDRPQPASHRARPVRYHRVSRQSGTGTQCAGQRRSVSGLTIGQIALRMPDRRCVRFTALRLRRATAIGHEAGRRANQRGHHLPSSGRSWHWTGQQDSRLCPAG